MNASEKLSLCGICTQYQTRMIFNENNVHPVTYPICKSISTFLHIKSAIKNKFNYYRSPLF